MVIYASVREAWGKNTAQASPIVSVFMHSPFVSSCYKWPRDHYSRVHHYGLYRRVLCIHSCNNIFMRVVMRAVFVVDCISIDSATPRFHLASDI